MQGRAGGDAEAMLICQTLSLASDDGEDVIGEWVG